MVKCATYTIKGVKEYKIYLCKLYMRIFISFTESITEYSYGMRKPVKSMKVFFATKLIFTHNKLHYIVKLKNSKQWFDVIKHIDIV